MTLQQLNSLPAQALEDALTQCCGSTAWVNNMLGIFPVASLQVLTGEAMRIWNSCSEQDWLEAFSHHPAIGDLEGLRQKFASTAHWAEGEQASVKSAGEEILLQLAEGNKTYYATFGYQFIVCATGRTAAEMLALLQERLPHHPQEEIQVAMKEQLRITLLRLQKLITQ